jgi:hypothetical protein
MAKYTGVSWHKRDRLWRVKIKAHGKHICLGNYKSEETAARVFDVAAVILRGGGATLNFPDEKGEPPAGVLRAEVQEMLRKQGV